MRLPNHSTKEQKEQRYATVLYLRRQGLTFKEIGKHLGVGPAQAQVSYRIAKSWSDKRKGLS